MFKSVQFAKIFNLFKIRTNIPYRKQQIYLYIKIINGVTNNNSGNNLLTNKESIYRLMGFCEGHIIY